MTRLPLVLLLGLSLSLPACPTKDTGETGLEGDTDTDTATDTDTDVQTEFEVLSAHMADNDLDLPALLDAWIVGAQDLIDAGVESYFIMDIRTADKYVEGVVDFEEGHIPGAHSVALADVVSYEAANNTDGLPVVVYCYTGHDAGHATMALRLAGVEAQSLKWGMSGWHSDFDLWTGHIATAALDYPDGWSEDAAPALPSFEDVPEIATGEETGPGMLSSQIDGAVLDGLNGITAAEVLSDPGDYFVINYWALEDYDNYGHIAGAYQVTPGELGLDSLAILDPAETIVIYCWTGQTGSMVAAWLNILGYDAVDLKFGANAMIYEDLESHTWSAALDADYDTGV